jgi:hypothetical protein
MVGPIRFMVLAASLCALASCPPAPTAPPGTPASSSVPSAATSVPELSATPEATSATVRDTADGFTFERPSSWAAWQPNEHSPMMSGPLLYLSTDPLLPDCAVAPSASPNPPDASGSACSWPLRELKPGGVLVTWWTSRILQPLPSAGAVVETNGAKARWNATSPGECSAVGADETVTVWVPIGQPSPLSNVAFTACLRGPDLGASEAAVRALLASTTLRR